MIEIAYALVLLGCGDDGTQCQPLAQPERVYADQHSCRADVESALNSDLVLRTDYPLVMARCTPRPSRPPRNVRVARAGRGRTT